MNRRQAIVGLLQNKVKAVDYGYYYTHFNVNIFPDGSISTNESSYSSHVEYNIKPILTVTIKYDRFSTSDIENKTEDFENSFEDYDYDELVDSAIKEQYLNNPESIDIDEFLEEEYK